MKRERRSQPSDPEPEANLTVQPPYEASSPNWSPTVKVLVIVTALIIMAALAWRFQGLLGQIIVAAMLAYLLTPLISFIDRHTPFLKRPVIVLLVYLTAFLLFVGASTAVGVVAYNQIVGLIDDSPQYINQGVTLLQEYSQDPPRFGPITLDPALIGLGSTIDLDVIREQLLNVVQPLVSQGGTLLARTAGSTLGFVTVSFFVFVVSIYLANEIPSLSGYISTVAQRPGYRQDAERLMREFGNIWSSYLRGQIVLGLVIGTMVSITLSVLGVRNSVGLGLLSGLLEFVPVIGPIIGTGAALIVAFFQPDNYMGLEAWQYAGVVLIAMIVIQQLENNILVPRIVGGALDLHPLFVMIAVFMGGTVAGILGAILAAPVLATAKLLTLYGWRKLFDEEPFPEEMVRPSTSLMPGFIARLRERATAWLRQQRRPRKAPRREIAPPQDAPASDPPAE